MLLGLPLAVASFVVLIVGLSVGIGLVVTVIGLPILSGTLYAARGLADIERLRLPSVLRQPRIRPHYRLPDAGATPGGGSSCRCGTPSPGWIWRTASCG